MTAPSTAPDADAVARAVSIFLQKMLVDDQVNWAFEGVDAARVEKHARAFVIAALGGPDLYVGRDLRVVHTPFSLRDEHFDRAVGHLEASLTEVGLSESVIASLAARLEPLRSQIVSA